MPTFIQLCSDYALGNLFVDYCWVGDDNILSSLPLVTIIFYAHDRRFLDSFLPESSATAGEAIIDIVMIIQKSSVLKIMLVDYNIQHLQHNYGVVEW